MQLSKTVPLGDLAIPCHLIQLHLRFFSVEGVGEEFVGRRKTKYEVEGLIRQRHDFLISSHISMTDSRSFEDRRISIFGILSAQDTMQMVDSRKRRVPPVYRVVMLCESDQGYTIPNTFFHDNRLRWRRGFEGVNAFLAVVIGAIKICEREWAKTLDEIDECGSFDIRHVMRPEGVVKWMFDEDFNRSARYFELLQVIRIFGERIRAVSEDIEGLSGLFLDKESGLPMSDPSPDEWKDIESNWKIVLQLQKKAEERLLKRISEKTDEIKSLRDGVSSFLSVSTLR